MTRQDSQHNNEVKKVTRTNSFFYVLPFYIHFILKVPRATLKTKRYEMKKGTSLHLFISSVDAITVCCRRILT